MKHFAIAFLAGLAFCTTSLLADPITPAIIYTGPASLAAFSQPYTLGYEFQISTTYQVNALGYFDDGNGFSHPVGIWDAAGNLLTSATVAGTDPAEDHFLWTSVNLTLLPGTYVIGGLNTETGTNSLIPLPFSTDTISTLPGFSWIEARYINSTSLAYPQYSLIASNLGPDPFLSVNFSATASPVVSNVPEPSSLLFLGSGLLALAGVLRRGVKS